MCRLCGVPAWDTCAPVKPSAVRHAGAEAPPVIFAQYQSSRRTSEAAVRAEGRGKATMQYEVAPELWFSLQSSLAA